MDLPAVGGLFGDAQPPRIEPVECRLDSVPARAAGRGAQRFAVLPGGIDSRGEIGVDHDVSSAACKDARTMIEPAPQCQPKGPGNQDGSQEHLEAVRSARLVRSA